MAGLYLTTLYTGYQGLKWREVRTLGDDMKPLQAQVKELEDQIAQYGEEYDTSEYTAKLAPLKAELDEKSAKRKALLAGGYRDKHWAMASVRVCVCVRVRWGVPRQALGDVVGACVWCVWVCLGTATSTERRRRCVRVRAPAYDGGAIIAQVLLACGVTFSIEGATDTYLRVGKLFPGPHLFAGAGITVLWAVAAALVPKMKKVSG